MKKLLVVLFAASLTLTACDSAPSKGFGAVEYTQKTKTKIKAKAKGKGKGANLFQRMFGNKKSKS